MKPLPLNKTPIELWSVPETVQCGFPNPAEDHQQQRLDLLDLIVRQADATFFMRVRGASMRDAGIDDGDYVVVDRSINAKHGQIVLAVIDGEFTIKRLYQRHGRSVLQSANPIFPHIELKDGQELRVWGVVTWAFKHISHV